MGCLFADTHTLLASKATAGVTPLTQHLQEQVYLIGANVSQTQQSNTLFEMRIATIFTTMPAAFIREATG